MFDWTQIIKIGLVPSVDLLLLTAARAYGDRLIAVILSGSGSDGTAVPWMSRMPAAPSSFRIPALPEYPSMPASLPPTVVDHVAGSKRSRHFFTTWQRA